MKKLLLTFAAVCIFSALSVVSASADVTCQPVYGGGQTCVQTGNIRVNKMVFNPQTNSTVENLGVNDAKFGPEQPVTFQITVTNSGNATLSQVTVNDVFPQFTTFVSGAGNFNSNTKTLTFVVDNLAPSESRSFNLTARTSAASALGDQGVVCVVNQANATSGGQMSADNAQFCIQKEAFPQVPTTTKGGLKIFPPAQAATTPPTGPEALSLLALIPTGALGYFIRKKAR